MALRQSEHGSVGEQQVVFVSVQRSRQNSRSLDREAGAAKDVLVSFRPMVRSIAPTRDDQKCIAFFRTRVVKRLLDIRLGDFFSSLLSMRATTAGRK